jgi:hypothetical protein
MTKKDYWCSFLASLLFLQVFPGELEKVGQYNEFDDFCHKFTLSRGKNVVAEESETVGEFKVICIIIQCV